MAVYTNVTAPQVEAFLADYDLGDMVSFSGIAEGVSNTNYHLHTAQGHFILTLFEPRRVEPGHLPFFLSYAVYLAESGVPAARPMARRDGRLHGELADRPAAIVRFMTGSHAARLTSALCGKAGALTAQAHAAGAAFVVAQPNFYGPARWAKWVRRMGDNLNEISFGLAGALRGEIDELARLWPSDLPQGAIHGDLFPDNVFFDEAGMVSGLIDFHFACTDFLAYDLAIVINAWCFDESCVFVPARYDALMRGYEKIRTLSEDEKRSMPVLLRGAALRFLLSRCEETLMHRPGDMMVPHDPHAFLKRLEYFQNH